MTGRETPRNGAERLYEENVIPRNSPAFGILNPIEWIGKLIDKLLEPFVPITRYIPGFTEKQAGYQTEPKAPAMASGYRMAMARQAAVNPLYQSNSIKSIYKRMA